MQSDRLFHVFFPVSFRPERLYFKSSRASSEAAPGCPGKAFHNNTAAARPPDPGSPGAVRMLAVADQIIHRHLKIIRELRLREKIRLPVAVRITAQCGRGHVSSLESWRCVIPFSSISCFSRSPKLIHLPPQSGRKGPAEEAAAGPETLLLF